MKKTTLIVLLFFTIASVLGVNFTGIGEVKAADGLTPIFTVLPGTTVEVGEEVLFDATQSSYSDPLLFRKARFEWDFGDGYKAMPGYPYYYSNDTGIAFVHFYMRPGKYTATLTISVYDQFVGSVPDSEAQPIAVGSYSQTITVVGKEPRLSPMMGFKPLLDLRFDGDLNDGSGNEMHGTWISSTGSFVRGDAGQGADLAGIQHIEIDDSGGRLDNLSSFTVSLRFRKNTQDTFGTVIQKPGQFSIEIINRGISGSITTTEGTRILKDFLTNDSNHMLWNHVALTYDGNTVRLLMNNREIKSATLSGNLAASSSPILLGKASNKTEVLNGVFDELRIYDQAIPKQDIFMGFEIWHAPVLARIAQFLYVQVPPYARGNDHRLNIQVVGDKTPAKIIYDHADLNAEEKVLFRAGELPADNYVIVAKLLDKSNEEVDLYRIKFAKDYNGIPTVGINEHNAICYDGEPIFVVTPWIKNKEDIKEWVENDYINTLCQPGYYPQHNIETWTDYLNRAHANGTKAIGMSRGSGVAIAPVTDTPTSKASHYYRNADLGYICDVVTSTKEHPGLAWWMWKDEPDVGGYDLRVPPQVLAAWTKVTNLLDGKHPVGTNLTGGGYVDGGGGGYIYDFFSNRYQWGGKYHCPVQIIGYDSYPIEYSYHNTFLNENRGPIDLFTSGMINLLARNYNLTPFSSFIETADVTKTNVVNKTPAPTSEQVFMEAWLHTVHGAKIIQWFHFFQPDTIRYDAMQMFTRQMKQFGKIILSEEPGFAVTDDCNTALNRVDTMTRVDGNDIYLFAVRLTEPEPLEHSLAVEEGPDDSRIL
jgi:hypothetical protein